MATNSNPYIVWQRIKMDVYRLSSAAKRSGSGSLIADTEKLIEVLNNFAELQALSPIPSHFAVPRAPAPTPRVVDNTAMIAGIKAASAGIDVDDNPYTGEPHRSQWEKGWRSYVSD